MSNLAKVKIRGRSDPLFIDVSRAQKLKDRKFGLNGVEKADAFDTVDLGEWAGEYGRVVEVEMPKKEVDSRSHQAEEQRKEREEQEKWLKLPPEQKGKGTGYFQLAYSMRVGDFGVKVPADLLKKVEKAQVEFYRKNPTKTRMSADDYGDLLPKKTDKSTSSPTEALGKKMAMPKPKKCKCGAEISSTQEMCGKCLLDEKNGELSTQK